MSVRAEYSGPKVSCNSLRMCADNAGLWPPLDTVSVKEPRRTTAGTVNEQSSGLSTTSTSTRLVSASRPIAWLTAGSSVAAKTRKAPSRSPSEYVRCTCWMAPRSASVWRLSVRNRADELHRRQRIQQGVNLAFCNCAAANNHAEPVVQPIEMDGVSAHSASQDTETEESVRF